VLANTIIVVVATVGTMGYLHDHTPPIPLHLGPMSLPMSGAAGFTTIGITILLFVFAETIPKQLAIYFHVRAVAALAWWIQLLMWLLIFPILALGIITPIKACIPDRE
jgi:CBS domain containing-hemolysin-like protein